MSRRRARRAGGRRRRRAAAGLRLQQRAHAGGVSGACCGHDVTRQSRRGGRDVGRHAAAARRGTHLRTARPAAAAAAAACSCRLPATEPLAIQKKYFLINQIYIQTINKDSSEINRRPSKCCIIVQTRVCYQELIS